MSLKDKNVIVTGGSRGLGLGLVEALVAHGANVTVVARNADALASVRTRLGVATISADITDQNASHRILAEARPDILALNAGTKPRMGRLDEISWEDFSAPWETDVKAGLYWVQAALNLPLKPGSRVLVGSSGAAQNGSPGSISTRTGHPVSARRALPKRTDRLEGHRLLLRTPHSNFANTRAADRVCRRPGGGNRTRSRSCCA